MRNRIAFAIALAALELTPAQADDSSAALAAGGLAFTTQPNIRMEREDLFVGPKDVRIHFVFANDSDKAVETLIAFPLPDIDTNEFTESPIGDMTENPVNFVGFTVLSNGKPVKVQVEQRAFYEGKDVTATLQSLGAPLNPVVNAEYKKLGRLPEAAKKKLEAAGLADREGPEYEHPHWTLRTKFYWTQSFPAHSKTTLDHSYHPVTGHALFSASGLTDKEQRDVWVKDYCLDADGERAIRNMLAARTKAVAAAKAKDKNSNRDDLLTVSTTDYILSTAKNWSGPIGHFHLTLDKLKGDNRISLCWQGELKHVTPPLFTFDADNFTPQSDIKMAVWE